MEIKLQKLDNAHLVTIDNVEINNVVDYEIKSSANGETELTLKLRFNDNIREFVMSESSE